MRDGIRHGNQQRRENQEDPRLGPVHRWWKTTQGPEESVGIIRSRKDPGRDERVLAWRLGRFRGVFRSKGTPDTVGTFAIIHCTPLIDAW